MNTWVLYIIIAIVLVAAELVYFRVADKYNLIEKQKENGHTSTITRRGGGVIFLLSIVIWGLMMLLLGPLFGSLSAQVPLPPFNTTASSFTLI